MSLWVLQTWNGAACLPGVTPYCHLLECVAEFWNPGWFCSCPTWQTCADLVYIVCAVAAGPACGAAPRQRIACDSLRALQHPQSGLQQAWLVRASLRKLLSAAQFEAAKKWPLLEGCDIETMQTSAAACQTVAVSSSTVQPTTAAAVTVGK